MEKDWVILNIDERRMWAGLTIKVPEGEEHPHFSSQFIEAYLRENGITAGLDYSAIAALSERTEYGTEVIVAKGKEPVNGLDGIYHYSVQMEDEREGPVVNEDGSVDYLNSLKLAMVKKDDAIAYYIPATTGEYGFTIFSEMLPPVKGRDLRPLKGKGLIVSEDGRAYHAAYDGRIVKQGDKIVIEQVYTVKGDLGIEQGNIRFNGDVEVRGDVRSGITVETTGSIFVSGHVGSSRLIAGKNITIRGGIQGRNKCLVMAGGDVTGSFLERCNITAEGSVYADSVLDCTVLARNEVVVTSRKGLIIGGSISAMQGIKAKEIGNDQGTLTILQVGVSLEYAKQASMLAEKIKKTRSEVELLDKNLKVCESLEGKKQNKETEALRMKIIRAKVIRTTELKADEETLAGYNEEIEKAKTSAVVRILGVVHTGIRISIGRSNYVTKEGCKDVIYKYLGGEVKEIAGDE